MRPSWTSKSVKERINRALASFHPSDLNRANEEKLPIAFILISVETGSEEEVIQKLKAVPEVRDVYFVLGVFDIIVKIEAATSQKLKDTITWKIRRIEKIRSTQTLMII